MTPKTKIDRIKVRRYWWPAPKYSMNRTSRVVTLCYHKMMSVKSQKICLEFFTLGNTLNIFSCTFNSLIAETIEIMHTKDTCSYDMDSKILCATEFCALAHNIFSIVIASFFPYIQTLV